MSEILVSFTAHNSNKPHYEKISSVKQEATGYFSSHWDQKFFSPLPLLRWKGWRELSGSHDGAAVPLKRPLQTDGRVVLAHASCHSDAQQLFEEQDYVPVELGRALHVTTLPGLLHQDWHCPARHEALSLQISLVAHNQDWHLAAAAFPAGARERKMEKGPFQKAQLTRCLSQELAGCVQDVCVQLFLPSEACGGGLED